MPTITVNGQAFSIIKIEDSARKHWGTNSDKILAQVYSALDKRTIEPDNIDNSGRAVYLIASCVCGFGDIDRTKDARYRDTAFTLDPDNGKIRFFHSSPRKKNWYSKQKYKE